MAPWGDLIVCEDTVGLASIARWSDSTRRQPIPDRQKRYSESELAGVCFSPDGKIMFVNIQYPGMTLAITGDWPSA